MDLYTMANPLTIVLFQLLVTWLFGKVKPIRSIGVGIVIITLAMAVNIVPLLAGFELRDPVWDLLPVGSLAIVATVTLIAFGELFASARMYEYIGSLAPRGQEGLFLGYASLPTAIGALLGGPVGAVLFNEVMCDGAVERPDGLLELDPIANVTGWTLLMGIGLLTLVGMGLYNRWLEGQKEEPVSP